MDEWNPSKDSLQSVFQHPAIRQGALKPPRNPKVRAMAKISKKTPPSLAAFELDSVTRLISEDLSGDPGVFQNEPITHVPNVDMYSTPTHLVLEVEMPGVRKEDIDLIFTRKSLTVKALKYECFEENKINYVCMERAFGRLFRTIEIPFPVDTGRIKAVFKNGMLTITVPRIEDKRCPSKRVSIESE